MAKDHKTGTILAFLAGIGIGAVAVLVLAPKAGDELRNNVTDAIDDSVDMLRDTTKDFTRRSQRVVETTREQVQDVVDLGTDAFTQAKQAGA